MPGPKSYNNGMENTIQYELTPKKVKNIIIRVKANGVVAVTMPYRMSKKKVDAFVQEQGGVDPHDAKEACKSAGG